MVLHHGQICFSTERILVQESIAPQFIKLLKEKAKDYTSGHAVTPQMANNANAKLVDAQNKGAEFLVGGTESDGNILSLKPTIVTSVTPEMAMYDEETFGPSASLYTFKDDVEAIKIANDSIYGLNAAIHTTNMQRGIEMARQLEVGQVHVNNLTEFDERKCDIFYLFDYSHFVSILMFSHSNYACRRSKGEWLGSRQREVGLGGVLDTEDHHGQHEGGQYVHLE